MSGTFDQEQFELTFVMVNARLANADVREEGYRRRVPTIQTLEMMAILRDRS